MAANIRRPNLSLFVSTVTSTKVLVRDDWSKILNHVFGNFSARRFDRYIGSDAVLAHREVRSAHSRPNGSGEVETDNWVCKRELRTRGKKWDQGVELDQEWGWIDGGRCSAAFKFDR